MKFTMFKKLKAMPAYYYPVPVAIVLVLWWLAMGLTPALSIFSFVYAIAMVGEHVANGCLQQRTRQNLINIARALADSCQAVSDRFSEYRSGFVDYAALKPYDPKQTADWIQGWNHAQLTWHNRRAAEQATAPPVPAWSLTEKEREALESVFVYIRGIIGDIDLWRPTEPTEYVHTDHVYEMFEKVEKIFDPIAGLPAQLALAHELGLTFTLLKESNSPDPRLIHVYRAGSELAKLDERRMEAISEDICHTATASTTARYAYMRIDAETLAKHVEYGLNIQVKLDDEGVVIDAFGKDSREVAVTWKMYREMGVDVRDRPDDPTPELRLTLPVYNGALYPEDVAAGIQPEWSEPSHQVLVREEQGLRIVLGTHDRDAESVADVYIERQPNAWVIFLCPIGGVDPVGHVYFFDDGKAALYEERHFNGQSLEILLPGSMHPLIDGKRAPATEGPPPTTPKDDAQL